MENVEMLQRSFENYLRVKPGKITVDITLADGKRIEGIRRIWELKKESQRSPFFLQRRRLTVSVSRKTADVFPDNPVSHPHSACLHPVSSPLPSFPGSHTAGSVSFCPKLSDGSPLTAGGAGLVFPLTALIPRQSVLSLSSTCTSPVRPSRSVQGAALLPWPFPGQQMPGQSCCLRPPG